MTCDVVYVLGTGSIWQDNELRYSLRSLETYVADIGQVYVVGTRPKWLTGVVHLPWPDNHICKERNIMEKIAYACGHPDLSRTFLHVNDDHFALAHTRAGDIPNYCGGPLDTLAKGINPKNHWRDALINTYKALQDRGHTIHNFDIHTPILLDKVNYLDAMDQYDWRGTHRGFVVKSLYGNTMALTPTRITDVKLNTRYLLPEVVELLRGRPWFSIGNGALSNRFKELLSALYPHPSKYEA